MKISIKKVLSGIAGLLMAIVLAGCGPNDPNVRNATAQLQRPGPIKVVTTTGMIADAVRNVGDERVEVQALMGPGVDPHLYKATPGDISKLQKADIIFYNGMHLEGKMGDVLEKLSEKKPVFAVTENVPSDKLLRFQANPEFPDPHIWFDVSLWISAVTEVQKRLGQIDAQGRSTYNSNAEAYKKNLRALHEETKKQIGSIPRAQRVLVTAHDAFSYFGKAYDIEVMGLQGISTASEASLRDVQRVTDLLVKRKIKAVFVESSVPRKTIEAVVQGAGARGHKVVVGGQLFSDAMGAANTPEGTYPGMVKHNVDTIVKALK